MTPDPTTIEAIRLLIHRYARAIDDRDAARFATCFTADAEALYDARTPLAGRDAIVAYVMGVVASFRASTHVITNLEFDRYDGAEAGIQSFGTASLLVDGDDGPRLITRGIVYRDRVVSDEGEWRIAHRSHRALWMTVAPAVDPDGFLGR